MHLHYEGSMIGAQCQLMICRGHIRASKGTFEIFLWLMVLWVGGGWGGWWMLVGGGWGVPPTHMHTHVHAHTCAHGKHDNFMQMAAPIGGIP